MLEVDDWNRGYWAGMAVMVATQLLSFALTVFADWRRRKREDYWRIRREQDEKEKQFKLLVKWMEEEKSKRSKSDE